MYDRKSKIAQLFFLCVFDPMENLILNRFCQQLSQKKTFVSVEGSRRRFGKDSLGEPDVLSEKGKGRLGGVR